MLVRGRDRSEGLAMTKRSVALAFLAALLVLGCAAPIAGAAGSPTQPAPTVIVAVLDGCPAGSLEYLPDTAFLNRVKLSDDCLVSTVRTVFPSSTAAGHAAIFTGTYPEENGITGKEYLLDDGSLSGFGSPDLFERPTLFHLAKSAGIDTAMTSAKKNVLVRLSGAVDVPIHAGDYPQWIAEIAGSPPDDSEQYADYAGWHIRHDAWIIDATCAYLERHQEPAVIGINLGSPDKCGHRFGPAPAEETLASLASTSEGLERLATTLEKTRPGNWCLIITADHGMTSVDTPVVISDIVDSAAEVTGVEVNVTLDGGAAFIWSDDATCGIIADALRIHPGVQEVIVSSDEERRADLHIQHPRVPPLIGIAKEGHMFIQSEFLMAATLGSHGTCLDSDVLVPLIVYGPRLPSTSVEEMGSVTHIFALVEELLGVRR